MFQNTKQIILKVTRGCNISCTYCYVFHKDKYRGEVMTLSTYEKLCERYFSESMYGSINAPAESNESLPLEIVFHGGEPLSIGKQKMREFLIAGNRLASEHNKIVKYSLQTNGLLIDDEWIDLLSQYDCGIGLSFDGFGQSDEERKTGEELIEILLKLKVKTGNDGALIVLHKNNYKNIMHDIKVLMKLGINRFKINRAVDVTQPTFNSKFELTGKEVLEVSKQLCELMWQEEGFSESTLSNQMRDFLISDTKGLASSNERMSHCGTRYCGAGKTLIEIEPDGKVQFCGRNSKNNSITTPGVFTKPDVLELQNALDMWNFHSLKFDSIIDNGCNMCPAQSICDGDCIAFQYQKTGIPQINKTSTCAYTKGLYDFFVLNKDKIIKYVGEVNESNSNINM